jgi:plastocyanin
MCLLIAVKKDFVWLAVVVAVSVTIATIILNLKILPEEHAEEFNALSLVSMQSEIKVIKQPTEADNTYIYAINDVAKQSFEVAMQDSRVKDMLDSVKGSAITIAAVQPSAYADKDGKVVHSSAGQVIITANWQIIDGKFYSTPASFEMLQGKAGESHQKIWNVFVDLDKRKVTDIQHEQERVIRETLQPNIVFGGMNMYMPDAVIADVGSKIKWSNESNVLHNVVGVYKTESGQTKLDSGFFERNESWEYTFNEKGVFEYHCTIHSEEGMKGKIIISG